VLQGDDYDRLVQEAINLDPGSSTFPVDVANADVILVALPAQGASNGVKRVVAGRPVDLTAGCSTNFF
jgi:hypothetical protein